MMRCAAVRRMHLIGSTQTSLAILGPKLTASLTYISGLIKSS